MSDIAGQTSHTAGTDLMVVGSTEELQQIVQEGGPYLARGGGSKRALSIPRAGETVLDLSSLAGIVEYDPGEYTFTARAGTSLRAVQSALAEHGQYLPFDPPLAVHGATLGGTVAAGLNGPGRYRYGGVRDFLVGVRFVDGLGRLVRGGGKVVKNAAGFDLPKLLVGSLGQLGILVEVTFKVFPKPTETITLLAEFATLPDAVDALGVLAAAPFDLDAVDLLPDGVPGESDGPSLLLRLGGLDQVLPARAQALAQHLAVSSTRTIDDSQALWHEAVDFGWVSADRQLVKVPITPQRVIEFDQRVRDLDAQVRYSVGGNVAWLGWPADVDGLDPLLTELNLRGLVLLGSEAERRVGVRQGMTFAQRIKETLDPNGRFPTL